MAAPEILIIDDTPANLKLLQDMLVDRGYIVRPVTSGRMGLGVAKRNPPDIILLDIMMPDLDGYDVCALLKEDEDLKDIPVLFLTAVTETVDKVRAFSVGGVDYITKPFVAEELEARIRTHLTISRQRRELQQQKDELQEGYDRLRELEKLKEDLAHMIVHDVRNVIQGVNGYLDLLGILDTAELSDGRGREYIDKAQQSIQDLVEMVNSLLDISRMEAGQFSINTASYELSRIIDHAIQQVAGIRGKREIFIDIPDGPVSALCDRSVTSRIVLNLLHNALKFTPEGGRILVGVRKLEGMLRVFVFDNGPGIAPEYHEKIFEKFGRVELRQKNHSTGLGLAFCKLAVEMQGGTIGVRSSGGQGSEFWFTIPDATLPVQDTSTATAS